MKLRDYQIDTIERVREVLREGKRRVLLQAPTGSGKTVMAAKIIEGAVEKGKRVLFLAHRRELVFQCSQKLHEFDLTHGIILSGIRATGGMPVQVGSVQTLMAWNRKSIMGNYPAADLLVYDECHRSLAPSYVKIMEQYPESTVLGLTATPCRGDGRGLGAVYEGMAQAPTVKELTDIGHLVPVRYFSPSQPDLQGVRVSAGDYNKGQLAKAMDKVHLVGDIVTQFGKICPDRQAICFAAGVNHSIHIRDRFRSVGITAEHIDGDTDKEERADILKRVESGDVQVLCNAMVFVEGWDCPQISCCIIARPTKSLGLYLQMAGRTLRPSPGKTDTILIDHAGVIYEHGYVDTDFDWRLDPDSKIQERMKDKRKKEPKEITCRDCKRVYKSLPECPDCGWKPEKFGKDVNTHEADLVELTKDGKIVAHITQEESFYRQLLFIQYERGYKDVWAAVQFRAKFKKYPPQRMKYLIPLKPGTEVLGWVQYRQIRYAKSRQAANG